jgi:hypothetical protein
MKVWWVLAYNQYYPWGELGNVHSTYETEEEAVAIANNLRGKFDHVYVENVSRLLGIEE